MSGDEQAILIVVAAYFALMGLISLTYQVRILSWPMINGTLVRSDLSRWGASTRADEQDYEAEVTYHYRVDGKHYEGKRLSPWYMLVSANMRFLLRWQLAGITRLTQEEVAVFYNPSAPKKSYLIKPGKAGLCVTAAMVVLPIIYLISLV
ncbi:MAG: DUF3592 domain-containing protein [Pseudomonadota bacterium]